MNEALARSEDVLNKVLQDFEDASRAFMKCRSFSNKSWVDICCRRLLEASDSHAALERALKEKV